MHRSKSTPLCSALIIAQTLNQVVDSCCRKLNLLSFGEEAEAEEQVLATVQDKIKSSHDVLDDPRLLKASSDSAELVPSHHYADDFILVVFGGKLEGTLIFEPL